MRLIHLAAPMAFLGCGGTAGLPGGQLPGQQPAQYEMPKASQDLMRQQETQAYERADAELNAELDRFEQETVKALEFALAKRAASPGMPLPESSSTVLAALRKAKFELTIETVKDQDGRTVNDKFLQLTDSFTQQVQLLSRKISEGKASKKEMKFVQDGAKHVMKLNDLRMQVMNISMATLKANSQVGTYSLSTMLRASEMVRSRKLMSMELDDSDYRIVRSGLAIQRRIEAIAATNLGLLATYQAVINKKGDPKALDVLCEETLKAFPLKTEASLEDAKSYVAQLGANVGKIKASYEAEMIKLWGKEKYEQQYKAGIDAMFQRAEMAQNQKSVSEIAAENAKKWQDERAAKQGGFPGVAVPTNPGIDGAVSLNSLGLGGISKSADGITALLNGDPRAAIEAAMDFVPVPGLKTAFSLVSNLLWG